MHVKNKFALRLQHVHTSQGSSSYWGDGGFWVGDIGVHVVSASVRGVYLSGGEDYGLIRTAVYHGLAVVRIRKNCHGQAYGYAPVHIDEACKEVGLDRASVRAVMPCV